MRDTFDQEIVHNFIKSGIRLWHKLEQLLKTYERFMWQGMKQKGDNTLKMGEQSGVEFVDSIFR